MLAVTLFFTVLSLANNHNYSPIPRWWLSTGASSASEWRMALKRGREDFHPYKTSKEGRVKGKSSHQFPSFNCLQSPKVQPLLVPFLVCITVFKVTALSNLLIACISPPPLASLHKTDDWFSSLWFVLVTNAGLGRCFYSFHFFH